MIIYGRISERVNLYLHKCTAISVSTVFIDHFLIHTNSMMGLGLVEFISATTRFSRFVRGLSKYIFKLGISVRLFENSQSKAKRRFQSCATTKESTVSLVRFLSS